MSQIEILDGVRIYFLNELDRNKLQEKYDNKCNKNKSLLEYRIKELDNLLKNKEKALKLSNSKLQGYILNDANDNIIEAISNVISDIKEEISSISKELEKKQDELNSIQLEDNAHMELIDKILEIKDIYIGANNIKKKAILNVLVNKVVVRDIEDFDIFLNI